MTKEQAESVEQVSDTIRLFHRTKVRYIPEIKREGLQPGKGYIRHYGITDYLLDSFAPKHFRDIGLLRQNAVFAWYIARSEISPLTNQMITVAFNVERSNVYVGDYGKSGLVIQGVSEIFRASFHEELESLSMKLNRKTKKKSSRVLFEKLFDQAVMDKAFAGSSEKTMEELEGLISRLREKMLRYGKDISEAYWENIIPFDEFERNYRPNEYGNWVSPFCDRVFSYPEAMVIGAVDPKRIEIIQRYNKV